MDAFRPVAASAMAANSFMRSAFAAGFPLFTVQMYELLGSQWASFLVACLLGFLASQSLRHITVANESLVTATFRAIL